MPGAKRYRIFVTLDKWVVNERIELVKNPNYWDSADTHLNKVTYILTTILAAPKAAC